MKVPSVEFLRELVELVGPRKHVKLAPGERRSVRQPLLRRPRRSVIPIAALVDGMGYLTALAKTDLAGELNYSERNIVEKLFQTYTMRVGRFHETWNGSQSSAERWLTAYTAYYNHLRSHQALENQTPIEALELEGSISSALKTKESEPVWPGSLTSEIEVTVIRGTESLI